MDVQTAIYPITGIFITGYLVVTEKDRRRHAPNHILALIMLTILIPTILYTPIAEARTITSKDLLESQYGNLGNFLSFGDRLYRITYSDGTQSEIFERTSLFSSFSKATIVEGGSDILSVTEGNSVPVNVRVAGINLPRFCGVCNVTNMTTRHRFEIFDDNQTSVGVWIVEARLPATNVKATTATFTIPSQPTGKKNFRIKECVMTFNNESSCVYGSESQSSETNFSIIWNAKIISTEAVVDSGNQTANVSVTETPAITEAPAVVEHSIDSSSPSLFQESNIGGEIGGEDVLNEYEAITTSHETRGFKFELSELTNLQKVIIFGVFLVSATFVYTQMRAPKSRKHFKK